MCACRRVWCRWEGTYVRTRGCVSRIGLAQPGRGRACACAPPNAPGSTRCYTRTCAPNLRLSCCGAASRRRL
eukprot:6457270-Pyramimonas_sp.AAC.1